MKHAKISDVLRFTARFFATPRFTGSILPSSRFLGRRMADGAAPRPGAAVVELGPGTGPVTAQILKGGVRPEDLYCIEFDCGLCEILRRRFPGVNVINASAEDVRSLLGERCGDVCAIVSSLPFLSLPPEVGRRILSECERLLPEGGRFVQFTYNLKRAPEELGFKAMRHVKDSRVYLNVPPARVDVFEKAAE